MQDNMQRIQGYDEQGGKTVAFNTHDDGLLQAAWSGNNKPIREYLTGMYWMAIEMSMPSDNPIVRQCERDDWRRRVSSTATFVPAGKRFLGAR